MTKKDISPQIARWALNLEDYKYTIEHRPGSRMKCVDALSQYTISEVLLAYEDEETVFARIRRNQEQDEDLSNQMAAVAKGQQEGYMIKNGILYKKDKHDWLIIVPKQM